MSNLSKYCAAALSLSIMSFGTSVMADCGPGSHWVDDCPSGIDESQSSAVITIAVPCASLPCAGPAQTLRLDGPTKIRRAEGSPHSIETEIISMVLTNSSNGITLRAGVDEGVSSPSTGQIVERTDTETANSFFDIYFEVEVPGVGTLHNEKPHRMSSIIRNTPPIRDLHFPPSSNTEMFDASGNLAGYLLNSSHVLLIKPSYPDGECGPGSHWIDDCPLSTDKSSSTAVVTVDMSCDGKAQQKVRLKGPTVIKRGLGSPVSHSIETEITSMNLKSDDGTVKLRAGADEDIFPFSLGEITELATEPALARSFFDIYFEVEMPGAGILHNEMPHRMTAVIRKVPPINDHHFPPSPNDTKLFDAEGNLVACLINSAHILVDDGADDECEVTVSPNLDIHIPRLKYDDSCWWVDLEYSNAAQRWKLLEAGPVSPGR